MNKKKLIFGGVILVLVLVAAWYFMYFTKTPGYALMQDNGKPVEGHASQMHYELAKDFVVLTGNAYLQQVDSNIKGDKITYLVKEQKMQAFSDKGKRVTTVLVPSQLQDKNNKGQTPAQKKGN